MSNETKSAGHICFTAEGQEFYELGGEVYRANLDSVMDVLTEARIGRWECSRAQFDRFREMLVPSAPAPVSFWHPSLPEIAVTRHGTTWRPSRLAQSVGSLPPLVSFWHAALPETYIFHGAYPDSLPLVRVRTAREWAIVVTASAPFAPASVSFWHASLPKVQVVSGPGALLLGTYALVPAEPFPVWRLVEVTSSPVAPGFWHAALPEVCMPTAATSDDPVQVIRQNSGVAWRGVYGCAEKRVNPYAPTDRDISVYLRGGFWVALIHASGAVVETAYSKRTAAAVALATVRDWYRDQRVELLDDNQGEEETCLSCEGSGFLVMNEGEEDLPLGEIQRCDCGELRTEEDAYDAARAAGYEVGDEGQVYAPTFYKSEPVAEAYPHEAVLPAPVSGLVDRRYRYRVVERPQGGQRVEAIFLTANDGEPRWRAVKREETLAALGALPQEETGMLCDDLEEIE